MEIIFSGSIDDNVGRAASIARDEPSARVVLRNVYVGKPAMLLCARCRDELRVG